MHELSITESAVEHLTECLGAAQVVRLVLEVGGLFVQLTRGPELRFRKVKVED